MAVYQIKLGGKERPISFCFNTLRRFGDKKGWSVKDLDTFDPNTLSVTELLILIKIALEEGSRLQVKEGGALVPADMTVDDLADWMDTDASVLGDAFAIFGKSQAPPPDGSKKE